MTQTVLMISKPVAPPWNDSSKNLVKDLALAGSRFSYRVLTPSHWRLEAPGVVSEPIYRATGSFAPALLQNVRVLLRLLRRDDAAVTHFFFAPNPRSARAARLALRVRPRRTLQTVCSAPASYDHAQALLFADRVVVLSTHTRDQFVRHGIAEQRLAVIPPGIQIPPLPEREARLQTRRRYGLPLEAPVVIYPGDYQFSNAAWTCAQAALQLRDTAATFVWACRIKRPESREVEQRLRRYLAEAGLLDRARFVGEVEDILALLAACDICMMPTESLYAKMDLPLVLLEAMALGVPLVIADQPPLSELAPDGVVARVPAQDADALAAALRPLLEAEPSRLADLRPRARAAAVQRYAIREVASQYEGLYEELIRG